METDQCLIQLISDGHSLTVDTLLIFDGHNLLSVCDKS